MKDRTIKPNRWIKTNDQLLNPHRNPIDNNQNPQWQRIPRRSREVDVMASFYVGISPKV